MSRSNLTQSVDWWLREEGDALRYDHGPATKYGIDAKLLSNQRASGVTLDELRTLGEAEARSILEDQWTEARLDEYPVGVDYYVFDCLLFCGRGVTIGWIGIVLQLPHLRCSFDEEQAARAIGEVHTGRHGLLIEQLSFQRRRRHMMHPHWTMYHNAWTNRVNRVQRRALKQVEAVSKELALI